MEKLKVYYIEYCVLHYKIYYLRLHITQTYQLYQLLHKYIGHGHAYRDHEYIISDYVIVKELNTFSIYCVRYNSNQELIEAINFQEVQIQYLLGMYVHSQSFMDNYPHITNEREVIRDLYNCL